MQRWIGGHFFVFLVILGLLFAAALSAAGRVAACALFHTVPLPTATWSALHVMAKPFFMPLLASKLLVMNNRREWADRLRIRQIVNARLVLFGVLLVYERSSNWCGAERGQSVFHWSRFRPTFRLRISGG